MGVTRSQVEALRPYLEGDSPGDDGEWGLHCPLHEDHTRSASMNVYTSEWYCQVCEIGGVVDELMAIRGEWQNYSPENTGGGGSREMSEGDVGGYHSSLLSEELILNEFMERRGLNMASIERFQIGWDRDMKAFTIPVRNATGGLLNIRRYQLDPPEGRRKIWSVKGQGRPALYPIDQMESDTLVICEGEWDAIATIQAGIPAITRTAAAKVWEDQWSKLFAGKKIYLCHDRDSTGMMANNKVRAALRRYAAEIRIVKLPYPIQEKHGKDLSDYWLEGNSEADFWELVDGSSIESLRQEAEPQNVGVSVLDTYDARKAGQTLGMRVDVSGKHLPGYIVPEKISYTCDMGAGAKCKNCPMNNDHAGHFETVIPRMDPLMLKFVHIPEKSRNEELRIYCGANKCGRLGIEVLEHVTIEEVYVRASAEERHAAERADYTNRRVLVVGHHDIQPNTTADLVGTVLPSPKTSHNEFLSWEATVPPNALDTYQVTDAGRALCAVFTPSSKESPLAKVVRIARDLSTHVTRIVKRDELHVLLDLAWHSPLWFMWNGKVERGWLDVLVVGDTRTGKSEAAGALAHHYGLGEVISCESASYAGIVGGLDQLDGKNWIVTWGVIPANDRQLVVLDEVSGLATEQISRMSAIRSSGIAELTKIRTERTMARTRLVWLGNPRDAKMDDFAYGVQAITPLIGNNEDVARFDLAFSLASSDVDATDINVPQQINGTSPYSAEAYRELIKWVWTRKADQVIFSEGTQEVVHELSIDLGQRYVDVPPLIQAANVRFKLARISAAIAGRTYSTDDGTNLIVTGEHVFAASALIDKLYQSKGFGYESISSQRSEDVAATIASMDEAMNYLTQRKGLVRFLKDRPTFKPRDLEDFLALSRDEAQAIMRDMYAMHVCHREGSLAKVEAVILRQLREQVNEY